MRRRSVGFRVGVALPIDRRFAAAFLFPPGIVVGGDADVREDRVLADHVVGVAVRLRVRARHDAEVARFGIDRAQLPARIEVHPGDVVAERPDFPALLAGRRDQHREIRLAACRRKRAREVVGVAGRALHADDQHVLGEPAFSPRLIARDAQRVTFLAEQGVAAVARAVAHDRELFGEVHDVAARRVELAGRVQALDEIFVFFDAFQRWFAYPRHEIHVRDDVGAIGDFHAATGIRRIDGTHAVRDHVHRAAAHATRETRLHERLGLCGRLPIVVGACVDGVFGANVRQVLDSRDVFGVRAMQVAARIGALVELDEGAVVEHFIEQLAILLIGAVAPVNPVGASQLGDLSNPVAEALEAGGHGLACVPKNGSALV